MLDRPSAVGVAKSFERFIVLSPLEDLAQPTPGYKLRAVRPRTGDADVDQLLASLWARDRRGAWGGGYLPTASHLLVVVREPSPYDFELMGLLEADGSIVGLLTSCVSLPPRALLVARHPAVSRPSTSTAARGSTRSTACWMRWQRPPTLHCSA